MLRVAESRLSDHEKKGRSVEQIVRLLMRSAGAAKHDPELQGDRKALERRLRELAVLAIAAMKK